MAIQINQELPTQSGLSVPEGSFISYETRFRPVSLQPFFILYWSTNQENAENEVYIGDQPSAFSLSFTQEGLTKEEFLALDPPAVEQLVMAYLENTGGIPSLLLAQVDILPDS